LGPSSVNRFGHCRDRAPPYARCRASVDAGATAFWYENSNGLAEIAINQGRADHELGLTIGTRIESIASAATEVVPESRPSSTFERSPTLPMSMLSILVPIVREEIAPVKAG
jgi:hypothetical protein